MLSRVGWPSRPSSSSTSSLSPSNSSSSNHRPSNSLGHLTRASISPSTTKIDVYSENARKSSADARVGPVTMAVTSSMSAASSVAQADVTANSIPATPTKRAASPMKRSPSKVPKTTTGHVSSSVAQPGKQNVVVCVRVRPLPAQPAQSPKGKSAKQKQKNAQDEPSSEITCWKLDSDTHSITATEQHPAIAKRGSSSAPLPQAANGDSSMLGGEGDDNATYKFAFDCLTLPQETSEEIYKEHVAPIIRASIEGYNGTVFAYGQTGSGKTHTMSGSKEEQGIIPRAVHEVFAEIEKDETREYLLRVSYLEIYNESLKDLLAALPASSSKANDNGRPASPTKGGTSHSAGTPNAKDAQLRIVEDKGRVTLTGLREEIVTEPGTVLKLIEDGQRMRHVGATDWNERSSRSHCVFQITIESKARAGDSRETRLSQLNLIDLAGSERAATEKARRKEGAFINKSLLTLGTVIAKLTEACNEDGTQANNSTAESTHIPYRDSKLTRLLQTSLGGNARVAVVCAISPDPKHAVESLSTLKFGRRCKMVVTSAKRGTVMDDKALLQKYKSELDALRAQLEGGGSMPTSSSTLDGAEYEMQRGAIRDLALQKETGQREVEQMQKQKQELRDQIKHLTNLILTSKKVSAEQDDGDESMSHADEIIRPLLRRGPRLSELPAISSPMGLARLRKANLESKSSLIPEEDSFAKDKELAAIKRELRKAEEDVEAKKAELVRYQEKLDEAETLIDGKAAQIAKSEERLNELKAALQERDQEVAELKETSSKLKEELAASMALSDKLKEEMASTKSELEKVATDLAERTKELHQRAADLEQSKRDLDEHRERAKTLGEKEELASKNTEDLNGVVAKLRAELEASQKDTAAQKVKHEEEMKVLRQDLEGRFAKEAEAKEKEHGKAEKSLGEQLAELQAQIKSLTFELQEARDAEQSAQQKLQETRQESKPLPVPTLGQIRGKKNSALKVRDSNFWSKEPLSWGGSLPGTPVRSTMKASMFSPRPQPEEPDMFSPSKESSSLQRAGSLREYRKYEPEDEGDRIPARPSALLFNPSTAVLDATIKAEREEIARLNAVIGSQRSLMADLEKSVALWKNKLRVQQDIINRLAAEAPSTNLRAPNLLKSPIPEKYHIDSPEKAARLFKESQLLATSPLLSSRASNSNGSQTSGEDLPSMPYYGAHLYNKSPSNAGLGLAPASPTKSSGWLAALPGQMRPEPLPLPPDSPSNTDKLRKKPRKTLENDMDMLRSKSRVDRTKSQLLSVPPQSPSKLDKADLAAIRSGAARNSKDYYI